MNFNHFPTQVSKIPVTSEVIFTNEVDGCPKRVVRRVPKTVCLNSLKYLESLPKVDDDELEIAIDSGSPLTPVNSNVMSKDHIEEYEISKLKKKISKSSNSSESPVGQADVDEQPF